MRGEAVVWGTLWRNTLTLALSLQGRGETQGTPYLLSKFVPNTIG